MGSTAIDGVLSLLWSSVIPDGFETSTRLITAGVGMVASRVLASSDSFSRNALRSRVFRVLFSRASGRIRPRCPRDGTSDAPVRMTMSPTLLRMFAR